MCLRIALVQDVWCGDWLLFPVRCVSVGQADGVPPQYPAEPYYHAEQGKRNPPSEHILSYFPQLFSPL